MSIFKKIGETIFKEIFKEVVDDFEKRISELDKEVSILKEYVKDNKIEIQDLEKDVRDNTIIAAKMEATINTVLYMSKEKINRLEDGNNK